MELVVEVWKKKIAGNPMYVLMKKLKMVKRALIKWKKDIEGMSQQG